MIKVALKYMSWISTVLSSVLASKVQLHYETKNQRIIYFYQKLL